MRAHKGEIIGWRRAIHAQPEPARREHLTTARVSETLLRAGLEPRTLPGGTGVVCEIGHGEPLVALRAVPRVQRRALVLHHGAGRSLERIAAVEGTSAQGVRLRLAHGAHALAHHHPATPTIPITIGWADLQSLDPEEVQAR